MTCRSIMVGLLVCLFPVLAVLGMRAYLHSSARGLPYHDSFAQGKADEWMALGGIWELANGTMRNDSDERGAMMLTGSPYWRNYSIEADVSLLDPYGSAGLIIRSRNEGEGINNYDGYYAFVRTTNNSLVLGRAAQHDWMEVDKRSPVPGGIHPFQWYHLKLLAYDCQIVAQVTTASQVAPTSVGVMDSDCIRAGRVGLRSRSLGGEWRNVVVRPASRQDLAEMVGSIKHAGIAPLDGLDQYLGQIELFRLSRGDRADVPSGSEIQNIDSLRLMSTVSPATATIRGVVILTTPQVFVQDSTGGVSVPQPKSPFLKVGDEVEVTGQVHPGDFSSTMEHASVRVLWAHTPIPAVSVTALQASTGKYDATFVEVHGQLTGIERGQSNAVILDLNEGPQSFRAIMNPGRSDYLVSRLKLNSTLSLRGVCLVDPAYTNHLTPFVLLLRSSEDLMVVADPPWWNKTHIITLAVIAVLLAIFAIFLFHRMESWRVRTILEERARLAHEIHDTLAQSFAGIGFQLQAIRNGLPDEMSKAHQQLELASELVRHSHEEARRSITSLHIADLESQDLPCALENCARRMVEGGSVDVLLEKEGHLASIPLRIADTLYRIGQEAISNTVRHAESTLLSIRLKDTGHSICMEIEDNGRGFVQGNGIYGLGIRGMRRRAESISAVFQLRSTPGEGTLVKVEASLPPRVTLFSWPKLIWKYLMEALSNDRPTAHANSRSYRR